jgi:ribosomal-protein-serine acetyltransferase
MRLDGDGFHLRPPSAADAPGLIEAVRSSYPELAPWMPWARADYGDEDVASYLDGSGRNGDQPLLIVEDDGTIAGGTGFNGVNTLNRYANLGYWVRSDRAGRGLARRAARRAAEWAFADLDLHRLEIGMSVENDASRRVAEAIGARFEGRLRECLLLDGVFHDAWFYSLLAADLTT